MPPTTPTPTYYTTVAEARAALLPGQRVMFHKGSGFYDAWTPAAPLPPETNYLFVDNGVRVSNAQELQAALTASTSPTAISLLPGIYDAPQAFINANAIPLVSTTPQKAVFTAGIRVGGNGSPPAGGSRLQGLAFNVTDPAKAVQDGGAVSVINDWGNEGANLSILDCVDLSTGTSQLQRFIDIRNVAGLSIQRVRWSVRYQADGIRVSNNNATPNDTDVIKALTDLQGPGGLVYNNGEQGSALWVGHKVLLFQRLHLGVSITAPLWTGNAIVNTVLTDYILSTTGSVGHYLEHFNLGCLFQRGLIYVGPGDIGTNCEWNDGTVGNEATQNDVWQGITTHGGAAGFDFDQGTNSPTVEYSTFIGQTNAAIVAYENIGTDTFQNNDYSQLLPGAVPVSYNHV